MPGPDGGLGSALVGEKILINHRQVQVTKLLGEGTKMLTESLRSYPFTRTVL